MKIKRKKLLKLLLFILIMTLILFQISIVKADPTHGIGPGLSDTNSEQVVKIQKTMGIIIGLVQWIGLALSIIMLILIGIEYFVNSHDPEKQAKSHDKLKTLVIGLVLILGPIIILTIIKDSVTSFF